MVLIGKSVALFVLAGLFEIGGGYLVWQWWRNGAPWFLGAIGAIVLFLYGVVPTYQPAHFGRVYAAYGGWFVVLSILWGWGVDRLAPDRYDLLGGLICLLGVGVLYVHTTCNIPRAFARPEGGAACPLIQGTPGRGPEVGLTTPARAAPYT